MLHQRLILKPQMHGIGIKIINWIGNWLHSRKQRVVVNAVKSEWLPVPQGSVLRPALFIIYINDIDVYVSSSVLKLADDTELHSNVCMLYECCNVVRQTAHNVIWIRCQNSQQSSRCYSMLISVYISMWGTVTLV